MFPSFKLKHELCSATVPPEALIETFYLSGHTFRFLWTAQELEVFLASIGLILSNKQIINFNQQLHHMHEHVKITSIVPVVAWQPSPLPPPPSPPSSPSTPSPSSPLPSPPSLFLQRIPEASNARFGFYSQPTDCQRSFSV